MQRSLNGTWTLTCFPETKTAPRTPAEIEAAGFAAIPATVPGDTILDLVRAGVLEDPFWGENLYACRPYEFYRWMYRRSFPAPAGEKRLQLRFEGVNTFASIYVNGTLVGACDNMLIPHVFDVTDFVRRGAENDLAVVIDSPIKRARAMDFPVSVRAGEFTDEFARLRMPPSCFGWDILCRMVSAGLWRGVYLEEIEPTRITQTYYAVSSCCPDGPAPWANLSYRYRFETDALMLEGFTICITGRCGESSFTRETPARFVSGDGSLRIENPRFWWPRGYGEADLYTVTMELCKDGKVLDCRTERIGIRKLEVVLNTAQGDDGEFLVKANGVPILCKGSNWVPLDALHSRDADRYDMALGLFRDMGCNILRCWGGNVYEDQKFYDLCDEAGILVWQDFSFACALYPQDRAFLDQVTKEAEAVIKARRNHPCILLWAGDNEVDEAYIWQNYLPGNNRYNAVTREALALAVRLHDPYRFYLPSSPYIPDGCAGYRGPEQHNWGPRGYYKDDFYKHTTAHFVSEFGYHGCPDPASLRKFIPEDELWPIAEGGAWDAHNTDNKYNVPRSYNRNGLMTDQVRVLCGSVPEDLDSYALVSQFSQAEAKKFFVERTRLKKWRRTGVIWWNMLDGWPQISDAIVDYYGRKKLAYTWLRRIHTPVCLMLDEIDGWNQSIVLGNDSRRDVSVTWQLLDGDTNEVLRSGICISPANENITVGSIKIIPGEKKLYLLRWEADGETHWNHYLGGYVPYEIADLCRWAEILQKLEERT